MDTRLIEFGLTVPPEFKFEVSGTRRTHYGARKVLQCIVLTDLVPAKVINCPEKARYGLPVIQRLKEHLPIVFCHSESLLLPEIGVVEPAALRLATDQYPKSVNQLNESGLAPLCAAALYRNPQAINFLLEHDEDALLNEATRQERVSIAMLKWLNSSWVVQFQ